MGTGPDPGERLRGKCLGYPTCSDWLTLEPGTREPREQSPQPGGAQITVGASYGMSSSRCCLVPV